MSDVAVECAADVVVVDAIVYGLAAAGDYFRKDGAFAVTGGRVVWVGPASPSAVCLAGAGAVLDLDGAVVFPGFSDMHVHPAEGGMELGMLRLDAVVDEAALVAAVAAWAVATPGRWWVEGAGWDAVGLDGVKPLRALDAALPDRPVFLASADGHSAFVNSAAMRASGLDPAKPPRGGLVDLDAQGRPTGWIRETATDVVAGAIPAWSEAEMDAAVVAGAAALSQVGITTVIDANADGDSLAAYVRVDQAGRLPMRVYAASEVGPAHPRSGVARVLRLARRFRSAHVRVDAVKLFLDGVVESKTAALLAPYTDGTDAALNYTDGELVRIAESATRKGLQLHAHAIGDRAVRQFLDVVEAVRPPPDLPPLAAHLEFIDPADVPRFAALGIRANAQYLWAYPDPYVAELTVPVVGERAGRLYPFGELARAGAILVGGSDWSVTTANPWPAIEVAVTRRDPDNAAGALLGVEQGVDLATAIRSFMGAANGAVPAAVRLAEVGCLRVGSAADFVVLDRDPTTIPLGELSEVVVRQTWFDGRRVF
ncbi:MAG: amidohydrolase [Myxococcales bacterium]|nr:amidohydrolase [Myxococcales bacterium]